MSAPTFASGGDRRPAGVGRHRVGGSRRKRKPPYLWAAPGQIGADARRVIDWIECGVASGLKGIDRGRRCMRVTRAAAWRSVCAQRTRRACASLATARADVVGLTSCADAAAGPARCPSAHGRVDAESLGRSLHLVGDCYSRQGKFTEALPWFERAVAA
jgi:hypothetical protein